ncbi:MAG: phospholipase, partial [Candidatus Cloacimonadota bacterium]
LKVFIAHGKEDPMVKFETGVKAKEVLEDNGYDITFHDFEGGHSVPEEILKKTVKWMKE